jgi:thioredoxin reductase
MYDVIIVGGGPAGLSAALVLGRFRRRVLACDAGNPRNACSCGVHGFLTRDGILPAELLRIGRQQLVPYGVEIRDTEVEEACREDHQFAVTLKDGERLRCRKLLLATGVMVGKSATSPSRPMARAKTAGVSPEFGDRNAERLKNQCGRAFEKWLLWSSRSMVRTAL